MKISHNQFHLHNRFIYVAEETEEKIEKDSKIWQLSQKLSSELITLTEYDEKLFEVSEIDSDSVSIDNEDDELNIIKTTGILKCIIGIYELCFDHIIEDNVNIYQ